MGSINLHIRQPHGEYSAPIVFRAVGLCLLLGMVASGCSYTERKAFRSYDESLAPVREHISEIQRLQPRLALRNSPESMRDFVENTLLVKVDALLESLNEIRPSEPWLEDSHRQLVDLWREYREAFKLFSEDLSTWNLEEKKLRLSKSLESFATRQRVWTAEMTAFHRDVTGGT